MTQALDRPTLLTHRLSTTVRAPVGKTMLVGGMTFERSAGNASNLYLFVRISVQQWEEPNEAEDVKAEKPVKEKKAE